MSSLVSCTCSQRSEAVAKGYRVWAKSFVYIRCRHELVGFLGFIQSSLNVSKPFRPADGPVCRPSYVEGRLKLAEKERARARARADAAAAAGSGGGAGPSQARQLQAAAAQADANMLALLEEETRSKVRIPLYYHRRRCCHPCRNGL